MILTLLFTTFFLQKGYFWAPLKMPTVPSSHCKRTVIALVQMDNKKVKDMPEYIFCWCLKYFLNIKQFVWIQLYIFIHFGPLLTKAIMSKCTEKSIYQIWFFLFLSQKYQFKVVFRVNFWPLYQMCHIYQQNESKMRAQN